MKFKTIFIAFNIVIILSFLFIFVMPLFVLGWDYASMYWGSNWVLALIFVGILAALNAFFIVNWRLFALIEREDWPKLVSYLEEKVFARGQIKVYYCRILINTYMVQSNVEGIKKLEQLAMEKKPALITKLAVLFGIPHLLLQDPDDCVAFFSRYIGAKGVEQPDWIEWDYAFALFLKEKRDEARLHLAGLCKKTRDPIVKALSSYLLASSGCDEDQLTVAKAAKAQILKKFPKQLWIREIEKSKNEVQAFILHKIVNDATIWLYEEKREDPK